MRKRFTARADAPGENPIDDKGPSPAELVERVDVAEGLGRVDLVKLVTMAAAIAEGLGFTVDDFYQSGDT